MRNRFHAALSQHCHNNYHAQVVGRPEANDWYEHINLSPKSVQKIENITHRRARRGRPAVRKHPAPTSNDVVSQMTFGFWPSLLNNRALPWRDLLPDIVPGHRYKTASHWGRQRNQDALFARLDLVNQLRNRIAHFEPVWKQGNILEEKRERQNGPPRSILIPAPTTAADALAMLHERHNRTAEILSWFSPDRHKDYLHSYIYDHFRWLCSDEGLNAYQQMMPGLQMPLSRFKRELNSIVRRGDVVRVNNTGGRHGTYYPFRR